MEEVATVELNYVELCTLLDSGTVDRESNLYAKLLIARQSFERIPKIYGKGFGIKVH